MYLYSVLGRPQRVFAMEASVVQSRLEVSTSEAVEFTRNKSRRNDSLGHPFLQEKEAGLEADPAPPSVFSRLDRCTSSRASPSLDVPPVLPVPG